MAEPAPASPAETALAEFVRALARLVAAEHDRADREAGVAELKRDSAPEG